MTPASCCQEPAIGVQKSEQLTHFHPPTPGLVCPYVDNLERNAGICLDPEYSILVEASLVLGDDRLHGCLGLCVRWVNETEYVGNLAGRLAIRRVPLAGCLPDGKTGWEARRDRGAQEFGPLVGRHDSARHVSAEVEEFTDCGLLAGSAATMLKR